eukprot:955478_1
MIMHAASRLTIIVFFFAGSEMQSKTVEMSGVKRFGSIMADECCESQLNHLWAIQESDREKGTKLLSKILGDLSNNLSESAKYGNLNLTKISNKLSRCKPAFVLLFSAGFKQSNDGKRLIWTYDDDAVESLYDVYNALQTRIAIEVSMEQSTDSKMSFTSEWQCTICQFRNKHNAQSCAMCQTFKSNQPIQPLTTRLSFASHSRMWS